MRGTRARVMPCAAGAPVRVAGVMSCGNCAPVRGFARELWRGYAVRVPCGCRGYAAGVARVCRGHVMRGALWRVLRGMAANARGRVARGIAGHFGRMTRHFGAWRGVANDSGRAR